MKSYSEQYADGVSRIQNILSKENVIKTEEKASLYDYLRIIRKYFRPFNKAFLDYSPHTSDDESLYKISVFPYYITYRERDEMWLWLRVAPILDKEKWIFLLKKEYNSDFFRYDDEYYYDSINGNKIKSSFSQQFALKNVVNYYYDDDFLELFTTMEDYFNYRFLLGIDGMTYKDSSFGGLDLESGFNYKINIIGDGSITCNLDFSELDQEVTEKLLWHNYLLTIKMKYLKGFLYLFIIWDIIPKVFIKNIGIVLIVLTMMKKRFIVNSFIYNKRLMNLMMKFLI